MARIKNGILEGFSGKVGNIVGCKHKSGFYIRRMPAKTNKPPTLKQLAQRARFKLAQAFLYGLRGQFRKLPDVGEKQIYAYSSALSQVVKQAIAGEYPDQYIDFKSVKLTSGPLHSGCDHAVFAEGNTLTFSWCQETPDCLYQDLAVLLAYHPLKDRWIYQTVTIGAGCRSAHLELPDESAGETVETWLYFFSFNGGPVSDGVYTGAHLIPGIITP